jgi:uncharacterized coiled-coil DUF342 family protein
MAWWLRPNLVEIVKRHKEEADSERRRADKANADFVLAKEQIELLRAALRREMENLSDIRRLLALTEKLTARTPGLEPEFDAIWRAEHPRG